MAFTSRSSSNLVNGLINNTPVGNTTPSTGSFTTLTTTSNATINGDLYAYGTTTNVNGTNALFRDPYPYLNNTYTGLIGMSGGFVINRLPTATTRTIASITFTPGTISVNPTMTFTGQTANVFVTGAIIQISNAADISNNGIFEVAANNTATTLSVRGTLIATALDFTQTQFTASSGSGATITVVNVSAIRCNASNGTCEYANGSSTIGFTYSNIVAGPNITTDGGIASFLTSTGASLKNSITTINSNNILSLNGLEFANNSVNPNASNVNTLWQRSTDNLIRRSGDANQIDVTNIENAFEFKYLSTITTGTTNLGIAAFSPNGKYLALSYRASNIIYIYKMQGFTPVFLQSITGAGAGFGCSPSFDYDGTRLIFGQGGLGTSVSGNCFVYLRTGDTYALEYQTGNLGNNTGNGSAINYAGDVLVIGQPDDSGGPGSVYVATRVGVTWTIVQTLYGPISNAKPGYVISISWDGFRIFFSVIVEDTGASNSGAVYVYRRTTPTSNTWVVEQFIKTSPIVANYQFGGFTGTMSKSGATIITQTLTEPTGTSSNGIIYIYKRSNTTWTLKQKIISPESTLGGNLWYINCTDYNATTFMVFQANGANSRFYVYKLGGNDQYYLNQAIAVNSGFPGAAFNEYKQITHDGQFLLTWKTNGGFDLYYSVAPSFVISPEYVTEKTLAIFNSTNGKTICDSPFILDNSYNLTLPSSLKVNTITEKTTSNGTTVNDVSLKNGAINLLTAASNPGTSTTLWQRSSDSHVFRGNIDLEGDPNYIVTDVTSTPFSITSGNQLLTIDTPSGAKVLNLPLASTRMIIKIADKGNASVNNITINRAGADTINGGASFVISTDFRCIELISNGGTLWTVFNR